MTIHELRANLESAQAAYKSADIEHPVAVHLAKEALTRARHEYWCACADLVERVPAAIEFLQHSIMEYPALDVIYTEITGEKL